MAIPSSVPSNKVQKACSAPDMPRPSVPLPSLGESVSQNEVREKQPDLETPTTFQYTQGQQRQVWNGKRYGVKSLAVVTLAVLIQHQAAAFESGCSAHQSSRVDKVLDSRDVKAGLDGHYFNGSTRGYQTCCSDAFHGAVVRNIDLRNNSFTSLPYGIFDYISGALVRVFLGGNDFDKFPSAALNSSSGMNFLDLSYNKIAAIDSGTMNGMTGVRILNLTGNKNMFRVPEDVFHLWYHHSLKRVILADTQIQHPLVPPPPHNMVCITDNPCNVTHTDNHVSITPEIGNKITFEITWNGTLTCEDLIKQLEAGYEVLVGEVYCENNVLHGTVKIDRKVKKLKKSGTPTRGTDHHPTSAFTQGGVWAIIISVFIVFIVALITVGVCVKKYRIEQRSSLDSGSIHSL